MYNLVLIKLEVLQYVYMSVTNKQPCIYSSNPYQTEVLNCEMTSKQERTIQ